MADKKGSSNDELVIGGFLVAFVICIIAVFKFYPELIYGPWRLIRLGELAILDNLPLPAQAAVDVEAIRAWLTNHSATDVHYGVFSKIESRLWEIDRWFISPLFLAAGLFLLFKEKRKNHSRRFDTESLLQVQADRFPSISMFRHVRPDQETDLHSGPWAWRWPPHEWMKKEGILHRLEKTSPRAPVDHVFDKEKAKRVLENQLSQPMQPLHKLDRSYVRVLAIILPQLCGDRATTVSLVDRYGPAFEQYEAGNASAVKALDKEAYQTVKRLEKERPVQALIKQHGFISPFIHAALLKARDGGSLPPNRFIWTKPINRPLWYVISDCGIQRASVESAGVRSHYLLETKTQRPMTTPWVESAIRGLVEYCVDTGLIREAMIENGQAFDMELVKGAKDDSEAA